MKAEFPEGSEIIADHRMMVQEAESLSGRCSARYLECGAAMAAALYLHGNREQVREGVEWARKAWSGSRDLLGKDHPETLRRLQLFARILGVFPEDAAECPRRWRSLVEGMSRHYGAEHPSTLDAVRHFAHYLETTLDYDEAIPLRQRLFDAANGDDLSRAREELVRAHTCLGHHEEAQRILSEGIEGDADRSHLARYRANPKRETLRQRIFFSMHCLNRYSSRNAEEENRIRDERKGLAAGRIGRQLEKFGYHVARQKGADFFEATSPGYMGNDRPHYLVGTQSGGHGADAITGAVVLLEAARILGGHPAARSLRFVVFTNEGAHARMCRERGDAIAGVICLDSLGYFSDKPGSQFFPPEELPGSALAAMRKRGIDPATGNFLVLLGNADSRALLDEFDAALDLSPEIPVAALEMPGLLDHLSYWNEGFPALLLTDTSYLRNPHYHLPTDTCETLDFERLAIQSERLAHALIRMAERLEGKTES